jgi:hypothetical protein
MKGRRSKAIEREVQRREKPEVSQGNSELNNSRAIEIKRGMTLDFKSYNENETTTGQ